MYANKAEEIKAKGYHSECNKFDKRVKQLRKVQRKLHVCLVSTCTDGEINSLKFQDAPACTYSGCRWVLPRANQWGLLGNRKPTGPPPISERGDFCYANLDFQVRPFTLCTLAGGGRYFSASIMVVDPVHCQWYKQSPAFVLAYLCTT